MCSGDNQFVNDLLKEEVLPKEWRMLKFIDTPLSIRPFFLLPAIEGLMKHQTVGAIVREDGLSER